MPLESTMLTALQQDVAAMFVALEIVHPVATIRLLDGAGMLTFGGHTYYGNDDTYGSLGSIDPAGESSDQQAPTLQITVLPANLSVGSTLAIPTAQGSTVSLYIGCFNPDTGTVIGTPDARFIGEIDTITYSRSDDGSPYLEIEAVSGFDRFFDTDDGARLSDAFHKSIWPGELGFQYLTMVLDNMPWGQSGTKPALTVSN